MKFGGKLADTEIGEYEQSLLGLTAVFWKKRGWKVYDKEHASTVTSFSAYSRAKHPTKQIRSYVAPLFHIRALAWWKSR